MVYILGLLLMLILANICFKKYIKHKYGEIKISSSSDEDKNNVYVSWKGMNKKIPVERKVKTYGDYGVYWINSDGVIRIPKTVSTAIENDYLKKRNMRLARIKNEYIASLQDSE